MRHGSHIDPPNRFESVHRVTELDHLEWDLEHLRSITNRKIEYIGDTSKTIVTENRSPDIPFRYSVNPYRGCAHGCAYCYARPGHEYLGFNAGLDFETKIVVKHDAPALLRKFLARDAWKPEPITFSGVTDCYQPAERQFQLTRGCLEVALQFRQPISIITKNALVIRDLDLLQPLAKDNLVHVYLSVTTLDPELARAMEPRTSIPEARLRAIRQLAEAGVPVGVMTAPVIPGLNDDQIPEILHQASLRGATTAGYVMLRLPLTVYPVFEEWLRRTQPDRADKVLARIQATRGGKMNDSAWGTRMTGEGVIADQIRNLFRVVRKKYGLDGKMPSHNCDVFRPPANRSGQLRLF
jgi:DNA repair photolyase